MSTRTDVHSLWDAFDAGIMGAPVSEGVLDWKIYSSDYFTPYLYAQIDPASGQIGEAQADPMVWQLRMPADYLADSAIVVKINAQSVLTGSPEIESRLVYPLLYHTSAAGVRTDKMGGIASQTVTNSAADYTFTSPSPTGLRAGDKVELWIWGQAGEAAETGTVAVRINNVSWTLTLADVNLSAAQITAIAAAAAIAGQGTGIYPIDHDGGTGLAGAAVTVNGVASAVDCMQFTSDGSTGVQGLTVAAYLKSDYDLGIRTFLGATTTGSDGRWLSPINLDSGTFYLVADRAGDLFQSKGVTVVVP